MVAIWTFFTICWADTGYLVWVGFVTIPQDFQEFFLRFFQKSSYREFSWGILQYFNSTTSSISIGIILKISPETDARFPTKIFSSNSSTDFSSFYFRRPSKEFVQEKLLRLIPKVLTFFLGIFPLKLPEFLHEFLTQFFSYVLRRS